MNIQKCGMISILGRPNVGKSTLLNALVGEKVAIISKKPQTTRNRITGIVNNDNCQFIFLDTPGLHKSRTKLGNTLNQVVYETAGSVDVALLVIEPEPKVHKADALLMQHLKEMDIPVILIINKCDTVKKEDLLGVIELYNKEFPFKSILLISAAKTDGTDKVLKELEALMPEGPALFPEDQYSDQPERQLVAEYIREKLLRLLDREVPHGIAVSTERFQEKDGIIEIDVNIFCEKQSHKGIIIGKNGDLLKKVGSYARGDMEKMLGTKVMLTMWVKVKEDWRNSDFYIKNFGFTEK